MSFLRIIEHSGKEHKLNCTQFRSPMNASITSAQTKTMLQHFPIRAGQPDINFTIQYNDMNDKHAFEGFVRKHQIDASRNGGKDGDRHVTLWWPERNIENWQGFITTYTVTERRFEVAPMATFGVMLTQSLMSEKTTLATRSADVWKILGMLIPEYKGYDDVILVRPTPAPSLQPPAKTPTGEATAPGAINSGDAPA